MLEALGPDLDQPVSIDTSKAAVAREAARLGASVVNDVWGLQRDSGMADAVAETACALVAMHNRDTADASIDILDEVERYFERSLTLAARAGVPFSRILLDPGVGFGKTPEQNHACIWNLDRFRRLGCPILVGLSRKSFIGRIVGGARDQRLIGTIAADAIALSRGASVLRVHDVPENKAALDIFKTVAASARPLPPRRTPTPARASCWRSAATSATRRRRCAALSARSATRPTSNSPLSRDSIARRPGARPTRTGSSTPAPWR